MNTATIYTIDGQILTEGLPSAAVCDAALKAARELAEDLGKQVVVEDPEGVEGGVYGVTPSGDTVPVDNWEVS